MGKLPQESSIPSISNTSPVIKFPTTIAPILTTSIVNESKFEINRNELNYPTNKDSYIPGMITVIYKNSYEIKLDKVSKKIFALSKTTSNEIEKILINHELKKSVGFIPDNIDDNGITKLKKSQKELSQKYKIDFPSLESIHNYTFPEDSDTVKICEELRKLPYVDTAYPIPVAKISTALPPPTFIGRQTINDIHKSLPISSNDQFFGSSFSEDTYWSWFNHHKIFQAWDIYKSNFGNPADISNLTQTQLPIIGVIDDGFYKDSSVDAPPYLVGSHYDVNGGYVDTDTSPHTGYDSNNLRSHGTSMANIIASPKNNSKYLCGVIPGARIYPVKIDYLKSPTNTYSISSASIGPAITAAANASVDVINVSLELSNPSRPISTNTAIDIAIQYAMNKQILVVIAAGNYKQNLNLITQPTDYGVITVGGSSDSSESNRIWDDGVSSLAGSNYGQMIDLAAQGKNIISPTWYVSTNSVSATINDGTSPSTAIVSGVIGMMKKILNQKGLTYTPQELREIVSHTGTLGISSITTANEWLGRGLSDTSVNYSFSSSGSINTYAEMRDLNAWAALTVVNNTGYSKLVRVFNTDDNIFITTNGDWSATSGYKQENYFNDAFWGYSSFPSGNYVSFWGNNAGGNASVGYQTYINGKFSLERIQGVLSRYNTATTSNYYYTLGNNSSGLFFPWSFY